MSRTSRLVPFALTAAVLLVAGCTSTVTGTAAASARAASAAPTTQAADPVAWIDKICGALVPLQTFSQTQPSFDSASDPAAILQILSNYLGEGISVSDGAIRDMRAAGPSPVAGGDDFVARLIAALTKFKSTLSNVKVEVDKTDATDPASIAKLPAAIEPLQSLADNFPDVTADLTANPELDRAAEQAPNCKKIG